MVITQKNADGDIKTEAELLDLFRRIRLEVERANSRPALTELYKRAGRLIRLTHSAAWKDRLGDRAAPLQALGMQEFGLTARTINRRAEQIGVRADYDETWGR